jgi:hypothetical protein
MSCGVLSAHYKLFTFLSVDMAILTPWSSQVHPEAQAKGVKISIFKDRKVDNELIPVYSQKCFVDNKIFSGIKNTII